MKKPTARGSSILKRVWVVAVALLMAGWTASAGLTVYYLRHAEGGHNVKAEYVQKRIPKDKWPVWVGNANMFTPKGEAQSLALTNTLAPFKFDLIAVSPLWRTRHTILPYLKATGQTAEIWPELIETPMSGDTSRSVTNKVDAAFYAGVGAVEIPADEQPYFHLRLDGTGTRLMVATNAAQAGMLSRLVKTMLKTRFATNDMNVLLVGHGTAGRTLGRYLGQDTAQTEHGMSNTHLWRVDRKPDGNFALDYYNLNATNALRADRKIATGRIASPNPAK